MHKSENNDFVKYLLQFPDQISNTLKDFKPKNINIDRKKITNIIYIGMGGSAIAGDIIKDALFDRLLLPINVIRGYNIPFYCNETSLVIACSYSGNTEETLSALKEAKSKKAQIAVITSGGELQKLAKKNNWTELNVPNNLPPRQAFGYLFFSGILLLNQLNICEVEENEIKNIVKLSKKIIQWNFDKTTSDRILTKELARQIQYKIPIIYSTAPYFGSIAMRWKSQFQENAKSMAFFNTIPEMNHNEIVGWEMDLNSLDKFLVIFLEYSDMPDKIAARIKLTKNIIRSSGVDIAEIYAEGKSNLEKTISLVLLGDWISYYLALLYNKNPESILNIDYLKSELKKFD